MKLDRSRIYSLLNRPAINALTCTRWRRRRRRIEYKLLSFTYNVLTTITTTQPPYLHHLISVQPPRSTRPSSLVILTRPPTSSSLRIINWSLLPVCFTLSLESSSLRQPHSSLSVSDLPVHAPTTSCHSVKSPLSPAIGLTPSLFHCRLKTYLFHKPFLL